MAAVSTAQVWAWLAEVPDPEIPVISVVDLGIVREVTLDADLACVVTLTPTYSGCPAMRVIAAAVQAALHTHGLAQVVVRTRLAPAWSTDWMSEAGKRKLTNYGIAPPVGQAPTQTIDISRLRGAILPVACPRCGSGHTRMISQFGSTPCKALYQCQACHEPFDYFKCH